MPEDIEIDTETPIYLAGIGPDIMPTLGCVEISILGFPTRFIVGDDNFQMPEKGLLGAEYLKKLEHP